MIIVAGWARTGTSIMFQCLDKSGFNPGDPKWLSGFKYKTENLKFRIANFLIMLRTGFKPLVNQNIGKYR